jgi:hypothetical protein
VIRCFAAALALWTCGVSAAVLDADAPGFAVEQVRTVPVVPATAYRRFVDDVALWYDPAHTWGGDAGALSIDAVPGGCFCERLADGGAVEHLRVLMARPGTLLRLAGGLGPLQGLGVSGAFTVTFAPAEAGGTEVRLVYRVSGHHPDGLGGWAGPVDGVLGGHMDRYADLLAGD